MLKKVISLLIVIVLGFSISIPSTIHADQQAQQLANNIVDISAGESHVLIINSRGMLLAWGSNQFGQLGDGSNINSAIPIQVGTDTDWAQACAGNGFSLAVKKDGTLWAWGDNTYGQFGNGDTADSNAPIQVGVANDWLKMDTGFFLTAGLKKDGTLWIANQKNNERDDSNFQQIAADNLIELSVGSGHILALKANGTLWAKGGNGNGELGNNTSIGSDALIQIGTDTNWTRISAGNGYSVAQKEDGSLWRWGFLNNTHVLSPTKIADNMDVKSISTSLHTMAVKSDGTLWTSGYDNTRGQIFDVTSTLSQVGNEVNWLNVQSGIGYNIGLRSDGTLWSWGYNKYGQLGNGTQTDVLSPIQIGSRTDWNQVSAGKYSTVAVTTYGDLWAWGQNYSGQLGDGTLTPSSIPIVIPNTVIQATYVVAGANSTFSIGADHSLWAWGNNELYDLGDGSTVNSYTPKKIGSDLNWKAISTNKGYSNTLTAGIKSDGTMWIWGADPNHKFYAGSNNGSQSSWKIIPTPTQVGSDSDWESFSMGGSAIMAIKTNGTLWLWGDYYSNSVGSTQTNYSFAQIGTDHDWSQVSANDIVGYNLAIKNNGSLWYWGASPINIEVHRTIVSTPTQLGNDTDWMKISANRDGNLLLKQNGSLWAMGSNNSGQIGDGTRVGKDMPVKIGGNEQWKEISEGNNYSFAIKSDGTLWGWGANDYSQLGNGLNNYNSEVQINFPAVDDITDHTTRITGITTPNSTVSVSSTSSSFASIQASNILATNILASSISDNTGAFSIAITSQTSGTKLMIKAVDSLGNNSGTTNKKVSASGIVQPVTGTVTGYLKDLVTSIGVSGASVSIYSGAYNSGNLVSTILTSNDGSFTFDSVPAGEFYIKFVKSGYISSSYSANAPMVANTTVNMGNSFINSTVVEGNLVSGGGALVTVTNTTFHTEADASGHFVINGAPTGSQTLTIVKTGYNTETYPVNIIGGQVTTINPITLTKTTEQPTPPTEQPTTPPTEQPTTLPIDPTPGGEIGGGLPGLPLQTDASIVAPIIKPIPSTKPEPLKVSGTPESIIVNLDQSASVIVSSLEDGHKVTTVSLDKDKLNEAFAQLKDISDKGEKGATQTLTIELKNLEGYAKVELPATALADAAKNLPNSIINIRSDDGGYALPVGILNFSKIAEGLGTDTANISISVSIKPVDTTVTGQINKSAQGNGLTPLGKAIDFSIIAEANGKKLEINDFGSTYVERTLLITDPIDSGNVTGVLFDPGTGKLSFVPSIFTKKEDGSTEIVLKRNGNSIYSVVSSKKSFNDISNHWAKADIELLASKLIVSGTTDTSFQPNNDITRAEFAALLVRSLGLTPVQTKSTFKDVKDSDWFAGTIGAAVKAKLVSGYEDGTFRPNDRITREQMAVMIARAISAAGKTVDMASNQDQLLAKFNDKAAISEWAKASISQSVQSGIISGMTTTTFDPSANASRAQAVVMLKRMLQFVDFIN